MSKVISFTGENLGHAATIAESEVTIDCLEAIFDAAVITAEPDNDGLYIDETQRYRCGYPTLVSPPAAGACE